LQAPPAIYTSTLYLRLAVGLSPILQKLGCRTYRLHFNPLAQSTSSLKQESAGICSKPGNAATLNFTPNTILDKFSFPSPTLRAGKQQKAEAICKKIYKDVVFGEIFSFFKDSFFLK